MTLKELDRGSLVAGGCMCLLGAFVIFEALGMRLGSPTRMGPGYYPLLIGIVCAGLGALILLLETRENVPLDETLADLSGGAWRSRVLVPLSMVVFALLLRPAGLVPACIGLVCVASLAAHELSGRRTLGLVIVTPLLAWLIFVVGLDLPITVVRGLS